MNTSPNSSNSNSFDSDVTGAASVTVDCKPNWYWLQARLLGEGKAVNFSEWISEELDLLEQDFESLITEDSQSRSNTKKRS